MCHKFSHAAREENREIELWPIDVYIGTFLRAPAPALFFAGGCVTAWPADRLHSRARPSFPRRTVSSVVTRPTPRGDCFICSHRTPVSRNTGTITRAIRKDFTPPGDGLADDFDRNRSHTVAFLLMRPSLEVFRNTRVREVHNLLEKDAIQIGFYYPVSSSSRFEFEIEACLML